MENDIFISVEKISRSYGQKCAIENVSFNVRRGEVLGFLGLNGAGKSTTMNIISGALAADQGVASIAGHDIQLASQQAKKHIGYLPEHPPLYNDLTVDEYLRYVAQLRGIKKNDLNTMVASCKQRCGLEDVGTRLIQNLSKGYKQRIGIAQAIVHAPAVIILDEPTSGLDPMQIQEIKQLILELGKTHSVILSTHILSEVQSLCDRVLIIHQGRIVLDQMIHQLQNQDTPNSVEIGLRHPPSAESLMQIDGVVSVETINSETSRIHFAPDKNAIDNIMQKAITEKWGLFKLLSDHTSLETIFMRLTHENQQNVLQ